MFVTGLAEQLGHTLVTWSGVETLWGVTALAAVLGVVLTEIVSNTAATDMLVPVVISVAQANGVNPVAPAVAACLRRKYGLHAADFHATQCNCLQHSIGADHRHASVGSRPGCTGHHHDHGRVASDGSAAGIGMSNGSRGSESRHNSDCRQSHAVLQWGPPSSCVSMGVIMNAEFENVHNARHTWRLSAAALILGLLVGPYLARAAELETTAPSGSWQFDRTISREVLENYLSRAITMEGLLNGRGDLADNIRMLKAMGAKFIGRSLCLWGGESNLLQNLDRATTQAALVREADPDIVLQACIFEIVTTEVERVPVPDWVFAVLEQPAEKRNFRYEDMLYPDGRFRDHWGRGRSVPDVSRPETKLWFFFLGASFIDCGCEAIHLGQTELMNRNDPHLDHYAQVLGKIRAYAAQHARRHMVLYDSHVPSGGLVREGQLLMDFHSFPLRIKESPDTPQQATLEVGFSDSIYGRSKGGTTYSGWKCEHLPYLVEIDNWGVSRNPGEPNVGGIWVWGYDEITWFAHQDREYRGNWLRYAWNWVRRTDPHGFLQMPGSRTLTSPRDHLRWYHANNASPSVPEGFGDEQAIGAIWNADPVPGP